MDMLLKCRVTNIFCQKLMMFNFTTTSFFNNWIS